MLPHTGLFQSIGNAAIGYQTTALSKFDKVDECLSGNVNGQIAYWHGKNCVQVYEIERNYLECVVRLIHLFFVSFCLHIADLSLRSISTEQRCLSLLLEVTA